MVDCSLGWPMEAPPLSGLSAGPRGWIGKACVFFNYWRLSYSYINTRRDMMQVHAFILFLYDLLLYLMIDAMYRLNLLW